LSVKNRKLNHAIRTRLYASPLWTCINRDMVNVTRHKPTNEPPKLSGQNVGLAVHRADQITGLQSYSFNLVRVNHYLSP